MLHQEQRNDSANLGSDLNSLQVRPVVFHRLWRTGSFGHYTPTKQEWKNKTPEKINSKVDSLLRAGGRLTIQLAEEGIPARIQVANWLDLSYLQTVDDRMLQGSVEATGLRSIDIGGNRTLGLIALADPEREAAQPYVVTVPDLAHLCQTDKARISVTPPSVV